MDNDSRITGFRAVHPGETLAEELKERGIKQKDLAKAIGIQPSHLNELIKGKRSFTTAVAMALEKELGIPYRWHQSFSIVPHKSNKGRPLGCPLFYIRPSSFLILNS